MTLTVF